MTDFTASHYCASRRNCKTCRDPGTAGRLWRYARSLVFRMPPPRKADPLEFDCPHGVGASVDSPFDAVEVERRRAICGPCPDNRGLTRLTVACRCKPCTPKPLATWTCPREEW